MCLFFVLNIWLVTMNVPYNDDSLANKSGTLASPFVIATQRAGVPWLGHVLNAFILIAVVSCGNSGVYIASRTLVSLSDLKLVHPIFGKKDKAGRPYIALAVCLTLGVILSYLTLSETGEQIYAWFSSLVSMANYITWFSIYLSHVRFRAGLKAQDIDFKSLPFVDRSAPWGQYIGLVVISVIIIFQGYLALFPIHKTPSAKNFFASYLSMPLFAGEFLIYKFWYKTKFVKASEMDFSAAAVFDEIDYQENLKPKEPTKSIFMRVVGSIF